MNIKEMMKKRAVTLMVIANLLILFIGAVRYGSIHQERICSDQIPIYSWGGQTGSYNLIDETYQDSKFWFRIDTGKLMRGIYHVYISYETNSSSNSVGYIAEPDVYHGVVADGGTLNSEQHNFQQEIWVNSTLDNLNISIDRENTGYMKITSIEVVRANVRSFSYFMLKLLLKLFLLDAVFFMIKYREKIKKNYRIFFGVLCVLAVSSAGVFGDAIVEGHDIWFHLARIEGIKDGLLSGAFPVKIQPNWLSGYGFAVSTMYGEALLYIPGMLRMLGMPLQDAYTCYLFMIIGGAVLISYFSFKKISGDPYIGLLGCALFSMSNYFIGSIWIRAGVGEYTAMIFLPLVILGLWELLFSESTSDKRYGWVWFALGYTGMIQSHALSCEIITFFAAFVCLLKVKRVFQKEIFLAFIKAVITVITVNLGFLIPFLDYMREDFKMFSERNIDYIQRVGISLYQLFSVTMAGRGTDQRYVAGVNGKVPTAVGFIPTLIVLSGILMLISGKWKKDKDTKRIIGCLTLAGIACFMSTDLFPWDAIAALSDVMREMIVTIRRPTRLMSVAIPLLALLGCMIFTKLKEKITPRCFKVLIAICCIGMAFECLLFTEMIMRQNNLFHKYDGEQLDWKLAVSGQEYFYTGTDCMLALYDADVSAQNADILNVERSYNTFQISYHSGDEGYIECPVSYYPDYRAYERGTGVYLQTERGSNNKLKILLPNNFQGNLEVRFVEPWYWRVSELISAAGVIIWIVWGLLQKRNIRKEIGRGCNA